VEKLATFDPLFAEFGKQGYEAAFKAAFAELDELRYIHHAGNSPGIVDGASLVVIGSEKAGADYELTPRARIRTMTNTSGNKLLALTGGIDAAKDALKKAGMTTKIKSTSTVAPSHSAMRWARRVRASLVRSSMNSSAVI
jgi:acetyl-CoA C-acetyltransferase